LYPKARKKGIKRIRKKLKKRLNKKRRSRLWTLSWNKMMRRSNIGQRHHVNLGIPKSLRRLLLPPTLEMNTWPI
jgi:hypothetical protein